MQNITTSAWNSSDITFTPQNCTGTGWAVNSKDGESGRYRRCTSTRTPSARLSFTGSAVFYLSTYFDNQTVQFCLDGICSAGVSLSPPQGMSANSSVRKVIWYREGLPAGERTLELFPANNGSTLVVDTFVYTTNETPRSSSSSLPPTSTESPSMSPTFSRSPSTNSLGANGSTTRSIHDTQTIGLIIGITIGALSGLVLLVVIVMMWRRRRRLRDMRRFHTFSAQTFQRRDNSVNQDTQKSRVTTLSFDEAPYSKSVDPIRTLPVSKRAGSSTAKDFIQSAYSYLDLDSRGESKTYSEGTTRHTATVNHHVPSYKSNYPKLEPLRKAA